MSTDAGTVLQLLCGDEFQELETGSKAEFITEHHWGYCRQRDGGTVEYQVEHPPWRVATAREALLAVGSEIAVRKPRRIVVAS